MTQSLMGGLVEGGVYAVLGVCVVVLYRMVGVLNIAQAAIGGFGAMVTVVAFNAEIPLALATLAGIAVGAALGGLSGVILGTWFAEAPTGVRITITVGILVTVLTGGFRLFGDSPRAVPDISPSVSVPIAGLNVQGNAIASVVLAVVLAGVVWLVLDHTDVGLRLRALAERPVTAELLGISVRILALAVWTVMGAVSVVAALLIAPSRTSDLLSMSLLIVPALAAGAIGGYTSLAWTFIGGLAIGLVEGAALNFDAIAAYRDVAPFLIIVAAVLWTQREAVWDDAR